MLLQAHWSRFLERVRATGPETIMPQRHPGKERRRGSAIIETALMAPWIFFLFIGVFDLGFYFYAADCTQNAARAAALTTSTSSGISTVAACTAALGELNNLPNAYQLTTCGTSGPPSSSMPVVVTVVQRNATTSPPCADCGVNPAAASSFATVTYLSLPMIPIPGLLMGQLTMTRTAEVRIGQ
jgi:Flp pilus assembly protein TadG